MLKKEPVETIMTKDVFTIDENDELKDAISLIKRKKILMIKGKKIPNKQNLLMKNKVLSKHTLKNAIERSY